MPAKNDGLDDLLVDDEFVLVIDSLRSVTVQSAIIGEILITVEDAQSVAIVGMSKADAELLLDNLKTKLGKD